MDLPVHDFAGPLSRESKGAMAGMIQQLATKTGTDTEYVLEDKTDTSR